MPRVFRIMKKDPDGLPTVSPTGLGVRSGIDINIDAKNKVLINGKGMSVSPNWRDIDPNRIPKRLRPIWSGASGSNNVHCFRTGIGPFIQGAFAKGLTLEPDSPIHGTVAPEQVIPFPDYQANLAATRLDWQIDET